ncbi:MAG: dTDP-4-dehydrorhamnose 3,5-epimerase [Pseudanabaenaceae cyanobacterium SKYGB_i_bin29]|nr:dTDP-4-dehydrorhamnose 3,5-epimerase [Pseudanabaenaceae cyanobacterium SKYG29]MDW8421615.1 dTDP-4-dehydrorhamnose 3,5-epimerase [Pseudanabaenaceae cyanobacterium SKYGB_i_bin29]
MEVIPTSLPDVLLFQPIVFSDLRGFFLESFNQQKFAALTGLNCSFVQDNHSRSVYKVLRGIHYQIQQPQGKLVRVVTGEVLDVAVDLRRSSPTCGQWVSVILSAENKRMLWIPPGFGHGFLVLSPFADFLYKTTDYYAPQYDRCILWSDPTLNINWGCSDPILSAKDQAGKLFTEADLYP